MRLRLANRSPWMLDGLDAGTPSSAQALSTATTVPRAAAVLFNSGL